MYIEQHLTIVRQEKKGDYTPNSTDMKRWWQRNRIVWTKTRDHFYVIRDKNAHAQIKMFSSSSRVSFAECHENEGFIFRRNFYMQHCRRPAHIRCIKHIHTFTFFSSQVCVCLWVCVCAFFVAPFVLTIWMIWSAHISLHTLYGSDAITSFVGACYIFTVCSLTILAVFGRSSFMHTTINM